MGQFATQRDRVGPIKIDLDARINTLTEWLRQTSLEGYPQGDLEDGVAERLCWHYGYLVALCDIREILAAAQTATPWRLGVRPIGFRAPRSAM